MNLIVGLHSVISISNTIGVSRTVGKISIMINIKNTPFHPYCFFSKTSNIHESTPPREPMPWNMPVSDTLLLSTKFEKSKNGSKEK